LHYRDKDLLLQIKSFFNDVGTILIRNDRAIVSYKVRNLNEIIKEIIPHFDKYPLITQKQSDFILFKSIVELIEKGQSLKKDSLIKIVSLKASLNKGLSKKLKISFPEINRTERLIVNIPQNIDYNWIAGFTSGEGCFSIDICKTIDCIVGYHTRLRILISQHSRDKLLMNNLINALGCGYIFKHPNRNLVTYTITNFENIYYKIIPLFNQYKIRGIKALDYEDFCKAAEILKRKDHLNLEGLEQIKLIKSRMNKNRYNM
jgi:hypothetical protein